jgi:hypothetical protein
MADKYVLVAIATEDQIRKDRRLQNLLEIIYANESTAVDPECSKISLTASYGHHFRCHVLKHEGGNYAIYAVPSEMTQVDLDREPAYEWRGFP